MACSMRCSASLTRSARAGSTAAPCATCSRLAVARMVSSTPHSLAALLSPAHTPLSLAERSILLCEGSGLSNLPTHFEDAASYMRRSGLVKVAAAQQPCMVPWELCWHASYDRAMQCCCRLARTLVSGHPGPSPAATSSSSTCSPSSCFVTTPKLGSACIQHLQTLHSRCNILPHPCQPQQSRSWAARLSRAWQSLPYVA